MSIPSGWAEFNDATAKLRGVMVAGKGTFSGEFTADSLDAFESINIRDGAVSTSYGFQFGRTTGQPLLDVTFTIPAQTFAPLIEIIVPANYSIQQSGGTPNYALYRNGALIGQSTSPVPVGVAYYSGYQSGSSIHVGGVNMETPMRFVDFEADRGVANTYRVLVNNGDYIGQIWGTVFVKCRKK